MVFLMHPASRHRQFVRRGDTRRHVAWHSRQAVGLLVLLGMLCTYIPLPAAPVAGLGVTGLGTSRGHSGGVEKDLSRPFPCAQRVCGCQSAEQCWRKCCCFTDAEKVAWADTHGVELPDFVRHSAARSAVADRRATCSDANLGHGTCAGCEPRNSGERSSSKMACPTRRTRPASDPARALSEVVIVQNALACQGLSWQWQFDPGTAPQLPMVSPGVPPSPTRLLPVSSLAWRNPSILVPVPPPRIPVRFGSLA